MYQPEAAMFSGCFKDLHIEMTETESASAQEDYAKAFEKTATKMALTDRSSQHTPTVPAPKAPKNDHHTALGAFSGNTSGEEVATSQLLARHVPRKRAKSSVMMSHLGVLSPGMFFQRAR